MSFSTLPKAELQRAATYFGTEVKPTDSKTEIIAALAEEGVTFDQYTKFLVPDEPVVEPELVEPQPLEFAPSAVIITDEAEQETVEEVKESTLIMRMTRENPIFQERGYTFTSNHPFAVVTERDADFIMATHEGFRPAMPSEIREYYG